MKALVTGASSGIGRDIARELAARGIDLVLVARRRDRMEELKQELPVHVKVLEYDLSKEENCYALYEETKDEKIDLLVNNAGFGAFGWFDEVQLQTEMSMIQTNICAVHILTKLFYRQFLERGEGRILNVASSAAFFPGPLLSAYYATKAYVLRLSEALYEEIRRKKAGITISVFCPGPVQTEFDDVADVRFSVKGISSKKAAAYAVRGMMKGKLVIVPGAMMKIAHGMGRLFPDKFLARAAFAMQRRKQG